jgi:hypothetical protein
LRKSWSTFHGKNLAAHHIEVCLTANQTMLVHMGIKNIPARSGLADALAQRDWQ